jgi:hypothetical protein
VLPPGFLCSTKDNNPGVSEWYAHWGWHTFILPFMEEQNTYFAVGADKMWMQEALAAWTPTIQEAFQSPQDSLLCPSDGSSPLRVAGVHPHAPRAVGGTQRSIITSNYLGSGDIWVNRPARGFFRTVGGTGNRGDCQQHNVMTLSSIVDGTSNTFMFGERASLTRGENGVWYGIAAGNGFGVGGYRWDRDNGHEGPYHHLANHVMKFNKANRRDNNNIDNWRYCNYSSMHPSGGQFAMGDGSVQFLFDDIGQDNSSACNNDVATCSVFERLIVRDDGQPIGGLR